MRTDGYDDYPLCDALRWNGHSGEGRAATLVVLASSAIGSGDGRLALQFSQLPIRTGLAVIARRAQVDGFEYLRLAYFRRRSQIKVFVAATSIGLQTFEPPPAFLLLHHPLILMIGLTASTNLAEGET